MKRRVLLLTLTLFACPDEVIEMPDATADAAVGDAESSDATVGTPDSGMPPVRQILETPLFPPGEATNQMAAPDFESKLAAPAWVIANVSPTAMRAPSLRREIWVSTPGPRPEVLILPGSDEHPDGSVTFGFGWVTGTGFTASVWLGFDDETAFTGQEVTLFGFEVDQGAVAVDLMKSDDEVLIEGRRWVRFSGMASGRYVGRISMAMQNFGTGSMLVNSPVLRSASPITGGLAPRAIRPAEAAWPLPKPSRAATPPELIGLPGIRLPSGR